MKKLFLIIVALIFCFSCEDQGKKIYTKYKRYKARKFAEMNRGVYDVLKKEDKKDDKKSKKDKKEKNSKEKKKPIENFAENISKSKKATKFSSIRTENKDVIEKKSTALKLNRDLYDIIDGREYVGHYKIGNPYQVQDITYYPQEYDYYEEVGTASWYGADFHGKMTANGETYNLGAMTAAHQTLPLPSMVKVTNLNNGKSVVVRVNDRGPFAKSRIIDLSESAAEKLGYKDKGTATVKVEYLEKETKDLLATLNINSKK